MAKRLNLKRGDHGIVFPPQNGIHYMQDGNYYDADGNPVEYPSGKPLPIDKETERKPAPPPEFDDDTEADLEPSADLQAWAAGKQKLPWHRVQAEVQRTFGKVPKNKSEAVDIIATHMVVPLGEDPVVKTEK